ncbi:ATP-binding protein [Streptomyces cellulosae]|uniref:ATP-binding protein n=1 Tax=Streptomyces cellulosae TaxID=1968 RepID=A0ABW7YDG9_STRCE
MTMPRQRGLTEQAADAAIDSACRLLRLPSIGNEFSDIADRAVKDQMTYRGFLAELLMTECDDRARRRSERRIKGAGFPREKSLRSFDFDANPNIDSATIHTLASCEWIKKSQPLCLIGDSGTGKSHMLIALGTEAAMKGYRVRYTLATKLVNELVEAADEKQLNKTIARYGRVDLLCIDELGYMELDRHGAELLFQVLTEREDFAMYGPSLGAEGLPKEFAELGGVRGQAGVPAWIVLEFRAETLGQESRRTVGQLAT